MEYTKEATVYLQKQNKLLAHLGSLFLQVLMVGIPMHQPKSLAVKKKALFLTKTRYNC